jgi:hypothetical protein
MDVKQSVIKEAAVAAMRVIPGQYDHVYGMAYWSAVVKAVLDSVKYEEVQNENTRLRKLYENVTKNRSRFGWTINHLLECEESLRISQEHEAELENKVDELLTDLRSYEAQE